MCDDMCDVMLYCNVVQSFVVERHSRTDRWVHFQQNAGPWLFVNPWIVHDIDDCHQFTVLLLTTSLGMTFQVVVILIG